MDILTKKLIDLKFPNNSSRKNIFQEGDTKYQGFVGGFVRLRFRGKNTRAHNLIYKKNSPECEECFNFTSIQFNKNYKIAKHKDRLNTGKSYIIALGDYEGGDLLVYFDGKDAPPTRVNIKNNFYSFDGNKYYHEVDDFTGNRISLVYYSIEKPDDIYQHDFYNYINQFNYIIAVLVDNDKTDLNHRLESYKNNSDRVIILCETKELVKKYKNEIDKNKYYLILFKDTKRLSLSEYIKFILPEDKSILMDF